MSWFRNKYEHKILVFTDSCDEEYSFMWNYWDVTNFYSYPSPAYESDVKSSQEILL